MTGTDKRSKAEGDSDAYVWRCESCDYTAATGSGAVLHELDLHNGAQTCWRTIDRDDLAG